MDEFERSLHDALHRGRDTFVAPDDLPEVIATRTHRRIVRRRTTLVATSLVGVLALVGVPIAVRSAVADDVPARLQADQGRAARPSHPREDPTAPNISPDGTTTAPPATDPSDPRAPVASPTGPTVRALALPPPVTGSGAPHDAPAGALGRWKVVAVPASAPSTRPSASTTTTSTTAPNGTAANEGTDGSSGAAEGPAAGSTDGGVASLVPPSGTATSCIAGPDTLVVGDTGEYRADDPTVPAYDWKPTEQGTYVVSLERPLAPTCRQVVAVTPPDPAAMSTGGTDGPTADLRVGQDGVDPG